MISSPLYRDIIVWTGHCLTLNIASSPRQHRTQDWLSICFCLYDQARVYLGLCWVVNPCKVSYVAENVQGHQVTLHMLNEQLA